jgi:hypothetical protein
MTINRGYRLTVIGKSDMSFWQSTSLPREAALLAKADWPWLNNSLDTVLLFFQCIAASLAETAKRNR